MKRKNKKERGKKGKVLFSTPQRNRELFVRREHLSGPGAVLGLPFNRRYRLSLSLFSGFIPVYASYGISRKPRGAEGEESERRKREGTIICDTARRE